MAIGIRHADHVAPSIRKSWQPLGDSDHGGFFWAADDYFCGQSSWLQIQRSGFDSRRYQIFWDVGLERGPLSLMSTIEELLERKSSGSCLEIQEYGHRDICHADHVAPSIG
jgi:hypothetical protein